jgi:outer membrane protein assembly factor BamB
MRKSRSLWQWLLSAVFVIFWAWFMFHAPSQKPNHRAPVIANRNSSMTPLWVRTNYYMYPSDDIQMVALGNKVFTIGSSSDQEEPRLIALDAHTGDIIWQYGDAKVSVLTTSENKLFVGELGGGRIIALNPDTGAIEWSTIHIGNVTNVLVRENILYVDTVSENYFLFDVNTGNILKTILYIVDGAPNDEIPIWSDKKKRLQFVGNVMYFQFPTDFPVDKGEITATDEVSGDQIWSSGPLYATDQIATSPLGVFVLDSDGKLLRFGATDGESDQVIQFKPAPTLRNGYAFGYYVAVDSDNQLLFVYLGDSAQLFAFRLP